MAAAMKLSLLCVSTLKPRALPFLQHMAKVAKHIGAEFVLAGDLHSSEPDLCSSDFIDGVQAELRTVHSAGFIESVLDQAIGFTTGDYVLRLDDDEKCSPAMLRWLATGWYTKQDHWCFPRAALWGNSTTMLMGEFFPDWQVRLSTRAKAGGRTALHQKSPYGAGYGAPACIEHWCFLAKSAEELDATTKFYHQQMGLPEKRPSRVVMLRTYEDGLLPLDGRPVGLAEIG